MPEYKKLQKESAEEVSVDIPQWGSKKVNEYKDIVLDTIKKIEECSNKQFRSAGTIWVEEKGELVKVELENTLKVYSQLVDFFEDIMLRFFDDEIDRELEKINTNLAATYNKLLKEYILAETKEGFKKYAETTKSFPPKNPIARKYEERYDGAKHVACRKRFQALLLLFARKRDLTGKRTASVY